MNPVPEMLPREAVDRLMLIVAQAAKFGNVVKSWQWIPPSSASQDPAGTFLIEYAERKTASQDW